MTQPTPGPWRVRQANDRETIFEVMAEGRLLPIAITYGDKARENAQLISTVHDLLHALENALTDCDDDNAVLVIEAAIRKAKGTL